MNELQTKVIDSEINTSLDYAKSMIITNDDNCRVAIEYEQGLSALIKKIDSVFDPHIKKAYEAHRGLVAEKKKHVEPVEEAKRIIKWKRIIYVEEQERLRKEQEAKLQAEARRLAEEAILRDAIIAEAEGKPEEAEAILAEPIHTTGITIQKTTPSAGREGAIKEIWSAEVYDLHALLMSICEGKASIGLIEPNISALNTMARGLHEKMQVAGVRAVSRKV
jgi:hypothetical protein